jgi:GH25 family lysozyme M1 (1,4-beta-N-acetylmuramidase)
MKQGIDVSLWNGAIDWSKVTADFAMLRIATGKTLPDTEFEKNYLAAKQYNIPLGAYYYMYATDETTALKEAI